MNTQPCKVTDILNEGTERHEFEARDSRGRVIGSRITFSVVTFEPLTAEETGKRGYYTIVPGTYYVVDTHATRDGKDYGAIQPDQRFTTELDRFNYVEKYLATAEKRAAKKAQG